MPETVEVKLVDIQGVEIMETGQFACASGTHDFTPEDLSSAIAALDDPAIKEPRLKLGHVGTANSMLGMPVFGKFTNLSLASEGNKLQGDMVGLPEWLGKVLPTMYPNRSIEGRWNVTTATGKTHRFVIDAVALLGVELPGISTLEDLQVLVTSGPPALEPEGVVVASFGNPEQKEVVSIPAIASTDPGDIRTAFYNDYAKDDKYYWWIHELYVVPTELIVEDEESGSLYRVPYTSDGTSVSFGDPEKVVKEYVTVTDTATASGATKEGPRMVFASRADSRIEDLTTKDEDMPVDLIKLRKRLGLPEDADEAAIDAALDAEEETPDPDAPAPESSVESPDPEADTPAPAEPIAASVKLDPETYAELQRNAGLGAKAHAAQEKERVNGIVSAAVKAGKIPARRKQHYIGLCEKDEQGTVEFLNQLAPGVIPVTELGTAASAADSDGISETDTSYPSWLNPGGAHAVSAN